MLNYLFLHGGDFQGVKGFYCSRFMLFTHNQASHLLVAAKSWEMGVLGKKVLNNTVKTLHSKTTTIRLNRNLSAAVVKVTTFATVSVWALNPLVLYVSMFRLIKSRWSFFALCFFCFGFLTLTLAWRCNGSRRVNVWMGLAQRGARMKSNAVQGWI